jgi:hypothetical protein
VEFSREEYIEYLSRYWREQQAVGKLAEMKLNEMVRSSDKEFVSDLMLFPPKPVEGAEHPNIHGFILDNAESEKLSEPVEEAVEFLEDVGVSVIVPKIKEQSIIRQQKIESNSKASIEDMDQIRWKWRKVENGSLKEVEISDLISSWRTNGRNNKSEGFKDELRDAVEDFDKKELKPVFLREQFLYGHMKEQETITGSAFDIDGLICGANSEPVPYEVKEKSVYEGNDLPQFGLDVSRLIVLLRVSQGKEVDPIYIVREVKESEEESSFDRELVNWWFIPISEIIKTSAWQVQGGGQGMGGSRTQTLMIPKEEFKEFDPEELDL